MFGGRKKFVIPAIVLGVIFTAGLAWPFLGYKLSLKGAKTSASIKTYGASTWDSSDQLTGQGIELLAKHDMSDFLTANQDFKDALAGNPSNQTANFYYALTRLVYLYENQQDGPTNLSSVKQFMDAFGIIGDRDIYNFTADFSKDANNNIILPSGGTWPSQVSDFMVNTVVPEIDGAIANLNATGTDFTTVIPAGVNPSPTANPILIDHGDVAMIKSALMTLKTSILLSDAYNEDVDISSLYDTSLTQKLLYNNIISQYPNLLTPRNAALLTNAQTTFEGAIDAYLDASNYIRTVRPADRIGNLVTLDPTDAAAEAQYRASLTSLRARLATQGPLTINTDRNAEVIQTNLPLFFNSANPINIRAELPTFDSNNKVVVGSFPDKTFGGVLPVIQVKGYWPQNGFILASGNPLYLSDFSVKDLADNNYTDATVAASFSDGDASVPLFYSNTDNTYDGKWTPQHKGSLTITVTGAESGLGKGQWQVSGDVVNVTKGSSIDECSSAGSIALVSSPSASPHFAAIVDLGTATTNPNDPTFACSWDGGPVYDSAWFKFTPTQTMSVSADVSGDVSPALAIFSGTPGNLTPVGCANNWTKNGWLEETLSLQAGVTYYIELGCAWEAQGSAGLSAFKLEKLPSQTAAPGAINLTTTSIPDNGGWITVNPASLSGYASGSSVKLTAIPATGFAFVGWSGDASGTINPLTLKMDADKNITANFTPSSLSFSFSQAGVFATFTGTLTPAIKGAKVAFYDGSTAKGAALTDSNGAYIKKIKMIPGTHTVTAECKTAQTGVIQANSMLTFDIGQVTLNSPATKTVVNNITPTLSWQPYGGATGYHVQFATSHGFGAPSLILDRDTTNTSVTVPALTPGRHYFWRVLAYIPTGTSMYSDKWSFIYRANTSVSISVNVSGSKVTASSTLMDTDTGTPVPGKPVVFYESTNGGSPVSKGAARTAASTTSTTTIGVAVKSWKLTTGSHQVYAVFKGNGQYMNSTSSQSAVYP